MYNYHTALFINKLLVTQDISVVQLNEKHSFSFTPLTCDIQFSIINELFEHVSQYISCFFHQVQRNV